jgi:hypothetical protein
MREKEEKIRVSITIGKTPDDGKWYGQCILPNGKVLSTKAFDSHKECRDEIEKFLQSKDLRYSWQELQ